VPANSQDLDVAEQLINTLERGPVEELLGEVTQVGQPGYAARSNGYTMLGNLTDGALAGTGVMAFVPVPVAQGDVISKISLPVGATAGATITHQFVALYSGGATLAASALLAQSTDTTNAAINASGVATWTLANPVTITAQNAPKGFVYAGIMVAATTVPTGATTATPSGVNYQWFTGGPAMIAGTVGTGLTATAPATLSGGAAKAAAPILILT
jgi:hypothetical protein